MANIIAFKPGKEARPAAEPADLQTRVGSLLRSMDALTGHLDHAHAALQKLLHAAERPAEEPAPDRSPPGKAITFDLSRRLSFRKRKG